MNRRGKGIAISYIYTILNTVIGFFMSAFVLRMLGKTDYGVYQTMTSFLTYLTLFEFGTGTIMTRNISLCKKDDSDRLLKNILPVSIAERMKGLAGEKTIADVFDNVTILFSDIVGFTKKTSNESAEDIVKSLNDLFSRFDERAEQMGVEKIKTIGDSYMAACGVPSKNENHALVMFNFALGMYKDLEEYNKTAKIKFELRIGLNSGRVIAGVIGLNKFIYDIWGDAVNVASRMESCCTPGHIRFTDSVKKNLEKQHISFDYKKEECDVKGKVIMMTYERIL